MTTVSRNLADLAPPGATADALPAMNGRELATRVEAVSRWRRSGQARLQRDLPTAAGDVVMCLPYLLHRNDPKLPGFQREPVPGGIVEYGLLPAHRAALTRYFGFRGAVPFAPSGHPAFVALFVEPRGVTPVKRFHRMDLHAFVTEDVVPGALPRTLEDKVAQIEAWALQREIAVRIRVHKAAGRAGVLAHVGPEQRAVLDVVYARGLLVAGQLPVWWLVSEGYVGEAYASVVHRIRSLGGRATWDFVDLGAPEPDDSGAACEMLLGRVTTEELPFADRLMALLSLQSTFRGACPAAPLATLVKRFLHAGAPPLAVASEAALRLDGLREGILERYGQRHLHALERLGLTEFARTATPGADRAELDDALSFWGERWGWAPEARLVGALQDRRRALDGHEDGVLLWDLIASMTESFANAAVTDERQRPALGRLLGRLREWLTLTSPKAGRDRVPTLLGGLVGASRPEDCVRIRPVPGRHHFWSLSRSVPGGGWQSVVELEGLVPVLAWACQNDVIGAQTRLMDDGMTAVTQLAGQLRAWFSAGPPAPIGPSLHCDVLDVVDELYVAQGHLRPVLDGNLPQVIPGGGNWDPLNYGQSRTSQLEALVHVERLAGGTCRTTSFGGTEGILSLAARLASPVGPSTVPTLLAITVDRSLRVLGPRLRDLLATIANAHGPDRLVLFEVGGRIYGVDDRGQSKPYDDDALRTTLAQPGAASRLVLDRSSRRLELLASALGVSGDDSWNVCYAREQHTADVFVCDDTGAVHWQKTSTHRLDGQIVGLLDVLREKWPGRRRGPESIELERMHDGRLRRTPSSHSTLRSLRNKGALRVEGDLARGGICVRLGDEQLCCEDDWDAAVRQTATALLARQRPGKEETPQIALATLTEGGVPLPPVALIERVESFRAALGREMRQALKDFRRRTP